jgi:uncharacterized phiE125 gp8 family phage protein
MNLVCVTPPTIEPVRLAEIKEHLRIDSQTLAGNLGLNTCIPAGSHPVVAGYTLIGTPIQVIGMRSLAYLQPVNNGTEATVDVKIQEGDTVSGPWSDWTGGGFTQVTEANDTTIQEIEYTGMKAYITTAAKTLIDACEFGTSALVQDPISAEDTLLASILTAAREITEDGTRRQILMSTWDLFLDEWPYRNYIKIPLGNLQNSDGTEPILTYKDSDGITHTMTVDIDYIVETNGDQKGRIVLPYGVMWPADILYPSNPIQIRFVCGWTDPALVPEKIKSVIKLICTDLHENREGQVLTQGGQTYQPNQVVTNLLWSARVW